MTLAPRAKRNQGWTAPVSVDTVSTKAGALQSHVPSAISARRGRAEHAGETIRQPGRGIRAAAGSEAVSVEVTS